MSIPYEQLKEGLSPPAALAGVALLAFIFSWIGDPRLEKFIDEIRKRGRKPEKALD